MSGERMKGGSGKGKPFSGLFQKREWITPGFQEKLQRFS
jgi:hypothetical protein